MTSAPLKPKHWLLARIRQWHTWIGLLAALFLLVFGVTGVVLNYKKPIFTALGVPDGKEQPAKREKDLKAGTQIAPVALPVKLDQALATAEREVGGTFERAELKRDGGTWFYKIKHKGGGELWVDAMTGANFRKGEYERMGLSSEGRPVRRGTDWGKVLLDLHTGKIGGEAGKAVMTSMAVALLFLSLSGVYLYLKPLLIRRVQVMAKHRGGPATIRQRSVVNDL